VVPFWQTWDEAAALAAARRELYRLAASFTVPTVLGAGLADGINPCAFAVVIFLVSTLTLTGGLGRWQALVFGLLFCLGVFLCYFLIGLGFVRGLTALQDWAPLARTVFLATGGLCLVFAAGAFSDVVTARRRGPTAMRFGMPPRLHRLAHRLIRASAARRVLGLGAVLLGVVVSGLELVCTGQVYLPVIVFINSTAPGRQSLLLLIAYNLAFITPLLVVVGLAAGGVASKHLAQWAARHAILTRTLTGIALLALGLAMLSLGLRAV
jgi:cytochrome c biogenesis protein CcdA